MRRSCLESETRDNVNQLGVTLTLLYSRRVSYDRLRRVIDRRTIRSNGHYSKEGISVHKPDTR